MAAPVQTEPGWGEYGSGPPMPPPPGSMPGIPPGLEYLAQIDQIVCKQKIEIAELLTGCEMQNRYSVKNSMGQDIYSVLEDSDCLMRICCRQQRSFTLRVLDFQNQEVIRISREFKCCGGCCWCASMDCAAHEVTVEAPPGNVVGYARQLQSSWAIDIEVQDASRQRIFVAKGPCCPCGCSDVHFPVMDASVSQEVCMITKTWGGFCKEAFTAADNFGVTWPLDLDVRVKATLIGTLFLIDFMAFENRRQNNNSDS